MLFGDKKDIYELMDNFEKSSLSELEISTGAQFYIKFSKLSKPAKTAVFENENYSGENYEISNDSNDGKFIKAPLVGTFYTSPSPDAGGYVKVGDKVTKGTVVCIIEAMKTMNEIESEFDGEVAEILVKNGSPVEYGQILFKLK
jgi:acetyl-CoA carboxylase biotin carboxyl carrier protein